MKKNKLLFTLFSLSLLTAGCTPTNASNSSTSNSSIIEIISGVEIAGPTSVNVGKTITLIADVIGSENDEVKWESNNDSIATVDQNGVVKGVSEGNVEITATSIKDSSKAKTITINVILLKATEISLFIEENSNIVYDEDLDKYTVPLGQSFYINTLFGPENTKSPDVHYSIMYPDGSEYNSMVTLENIENSNRAKITSFIALKGVIIKANGTFNDLTGNDLYDSIIVDIIDNNLESFNSLISTVQSFKEKEQSSLIKSSITRTKTTTQNNNTIKKVEDIEHQSFINASYTNKNIKTYSNNTLNNEENHYYYQGVSEINNVQGYYAFEYDNNTNKILELYDKVIENNSTTIDNYIDKSSLLFDKYNSITYGYSELLLNILNSSSYLYEGDLSSFGNSYIYARANYEIKTNSFKITSTYEDENSNLHYSLSLEVNYSNDLIESYRFTEDVLIKGLEKNDISINFIEEANDFVYSNKLNDTNDNNENYLDLNQYLVTDFEVIEFNEKDKDGKYDYSNKDKYGADIVNNNQELTKYTISYDKALVLKMNALTPNTADLNFDTFKCSSSNINQIPNSESIHDGIFVINAKKDPVTAKYSEGIAIFTFTSSLGVEKKIIVEFVKTSLKKVTVTYGNETPTFNETSNRYVFTSIFEGEYSSYFYINTTPDESKYEFGINIIEGNQNGIELYQYEDNNIYGYPGFSYAIHGISPGTYAFEVYVIGYESIKDSKTYEITVEEAYSSEFIAQSIIGKTYSNKASISTYSFIFESETTLKYIQNDYDETLEKTFDYHIEKGHIIIDEIQSFDAGMYYSRINKGDIYFAKDFKTLNINLEIYDADRLAGVSAFSYHEFKYTPEKVTIDNLIDYINGKTLNDSEGIISVSFDNGKGTFYFYNYSKEVLAIFEFDYKYDNNAFVVYNSTSNTNDYNLIDNKCEFDEYNQRFVFRINNNIYGGDDRYYVNLY